MKGNNVLFSFLPKIYYIMALSFLKTGKPLLGLFLMFMITTFLCIPKTLGTHFQKNNQSNNGISECHAHLQLCHCMTLRVNSGVVFT